MIVISGALVLVALVLLIIGVVGPDLTFVYASIAVSLVSLVFLVIGILQRRGETAPAADATASQKPAPAKESDESVTTVIPTQEPRRGRPAEEPAPVADTADEELELGGTVLIVEGRPRYHVDGCRYLSGKQTEKIDVLDAREEGFSPCGVCKPDDALAAAEAEDEFEDEPTTAQEEPVVEEDVPGVDVAPARKAPAKKAAKKAPAKKATTRAATTRAATTTSTSKKVPSKAASAAAAASPAAVSARAKPGSVVAVPERGRYHRAECRYVRDVDGEPMSKTAANRAGLAACGVCKP